VRDRRATLLVGLSIPICLTVTLVMLYVFDRTLNVISLAGLAFGVGQSLDTAIVMLEAIAQQRERGLNRIDATLAGAKQVWPALLASTVTAVIVFLPIVFMQDAVSQLFADLALTISIAVIASLIVAVTALPLAASRWLDAEKIHKGENNRYAAVANWIVRWTDSSRRRYATVAVLFLAPVVLTWVLLPPLDYLPPVKRDAIDGFIQLPPGTNIDTVEREFVKPVAERLAPYMAGEKEPRLKNYYILAGAFGTTIGVRPLDPDHIDELNTLDATSTCNCRPRTSSNCWPRHVSLRNSSRKKCRVRRCRPSRTWRWRTRNCGSTPTIAASTKSAGREATSAPWCARWVTGCSSANTSTASGGWT
jgi:multidrug efflux pump subunit AcrB